MEFHEQLWVPWWWWVVGIGASASTAYTVSLAFRPFPYWIPAMVCAVLAVLVLFWLSRHTIDVDDRGELHAGGAHLPLSQTGRTAVISSAEKSAALGRQFDPAAFLIHRAWVKTLVLIVVEDSRDPTPYWLISTARPHALLEVITHWQSLPAGGN